MSVPTRTSPGSSPLVVTASPIPRLGAGIASSHRGTAPSAGPVGRRTTGAQRSRRRGSSIAATPPRPRSTVDTTVSDRPFSAGPHSVTVASTASTRLVCARLTAPLGRQVRHHFTRVPAGRAGLARRVRQPGLHGIDVTAGRPWARSTARSVVAPAATAPSLTEGGGTWRRRPATGRAIDLAAPRRTGGAHAGDGT